MFYSTTSRKMGRKEDGKPWRGGEEKSLVMM
jgi:hypothetical protein